VKEYAVISRLVERRSEPREQVDQYYNVEFLTDGLDAAHKVNIWDKSTKSICLLVKEDSDILTQLKVGDTLKMIYYPTDSVYPCVYVGATIRHITKRGHARLKDHYSVGLEFLRNQDRTRLIRLI